jgi:hypothetical protein
LKARLDVNGIQKDSRSLGRAAAARGLSARAIDQVLLVEAANSYNEMRAQASDYCEATAASGGNQSEPQSSDLSLTARVRGNQIE